MKNPTQQSRPSSSRPQPATATQPQPSAQFPGAGPGAPAAHPPSASELASEEARRGEPLTPASPKERSPKQENL